MKEIVFYIEGGVVHGVRAPKGYKIVVIDSDIDGLDQADVCEGCKYDEDHHYHHKGISRCSK